LKNKLPFIFNINKIIKNNFYILKKAFICDPFCFFATITYGACHELVVFYEHVYTVVFLINAVQNKTPFIEVLRYIIVLFIVVTVWLVFVSFYNSIFGRKYQLKLKKKIQLEIYEKTLEMDLDCYENTQFYNDFIWAMNESVPRVNEVMTTTDNLLKCLMVIATSSVLMISLDKVSLLFVLFSLIATSFINLKISKIQFNYDNDLKPVKRKSDYINRIFYLVDYAKEIRLSEVSKKLMRNFKTSNDDTNFLIKKYSKPSFLLSFLNEYVFSSFILDGVYVIYLMFKALVLKTITYGGLIGLYNSSWRLRGSLQNMSSIIPQYSKHSMYIDRIKTFFEYVPKIKNNDTALKVPVLPSVIEYRNVSFKYVGTDIWALKNVNLKINADEKIALVGYNGAGKSTFIKLLMRLYDVTEGEIFYNGINIKDYDLKSYREMFGVTFQDFQLFAATIGENVAMDELTDKDDYIVQHALELSGFKDKLSSLQNGIYTQLTREFSDDGINLSGGEAQKIAISRTFFKQCRFLVLDEPSSALDPVSEYNFNESMLKASDSKTVVFISHRLSTTRMADKIYMLINGEIVEEGNHDLLMKQNNKYAEMFNMQSEKYIQGILH
jgi:ATP-binding cassette subfamily B protein